MRSRRSSNAIASSLQGLIDEASCSLCGQLFVDPYALGCAHTFYRACIDDKMAGKSQCPTCKLPMRPKDLRPDTLIVSCARARRWYIPDALAAPQRLAHTRTRPFR